MYSRSLDPRRVSSPLPSHYSGSAFRSDGTPTPIPVRREHDPIPRHSNLEKEAQVHSEAERSEAFRDLSTEASDEALVNPPDENEDSMSSLPRQILEETTDAPTEGRDKCKDAPFLTRLLGGFLPGLRDDDILLILLIFLLSRENGNEDVILLLAFLLFGK